MIETIASMALGGAARLVPEVLKWLDRKDERKHELSMFDRQLEADRIKLDASQKLAETQAEERVTVADLQALVEATKAQAQPTGIRWVDAMNALVRPVLAFQWLILLWPAVIVAGFVLAVQAGADPLAAMVKAFGADEKTMAASVASFWLVDRSLRKLSGR